MSVITAVTIDTFNHIYNSIMTFIHIFNNDLKELNLELNELGSGSDSDSEMNSMSMDSGMSMGSDLDRRDINNFITNFMSGLNIGIISFGHILFGIILSFVLSFGFVSIIYYTFHYAVMGSCYLFNMLWNSFDKGHEWAQFVTLITGFGIYVYIMCSSNNNNIDNYIYKLKSEIDEKNAIINELQMKLDNKLNMISKWSEMDSDLAKKLESESEDDTVWETESETDSE
jgi:hypothetical protein